MGIGNKTVQRTMPSIGNKSYQSNNKIGGKFNILGEKNRNAFKEAEEKPKSSGLEK